MSIRLNLSRRYTSTITKEDFYGDIAVAYILIAIVALIAIFLGVLIWLGESSDFDHEDKIYRTLQGENLVFDDKNKSSIETAQTFRLLYAKQYNFSRLNGIDEDNLSAARELVDSAMKNWNARAMYLDNASMPLAENKIADEISGFIRVLIIFLAIVIPSVIYAKRDDDHSNEWWQYPWKKWWAYPAIIPLAPYVIIIQPFVLLYAIINEARHFAMTIRGGNAPENTNAPERIERIRSQGDRNIINDEYIMEQRKEFDTIVASIAEKREKAKENFTNIGKILLGLKKQQLEKEIKEIKLKMSESGKQIQVHQKNIGIRAGEIREIERSLEEKDRPEAAEEFEKILSLSLVRTIDVEGALIKVYTKTINIEHEGKKYEIGDAIIKINAYENDARINIVGSTSIKMGHPHSRQGDGNFCFGDYSSDIYDNISSGNYYQAMLIILHSLQTIEVAEWGSRMNEWKEV